MAKNEQIRIRLKIDQKTFQQIEDLSIKQSLSIPKTIKFLSDYHLINQIFHKSKSLDENFNNWAQNENS